MAGIFNSAIFNNAIFNTGEAAAVVAVSPTGGWERQPFYDPQQRRRIATKLGIPDVVEEFIAEQEQPKARRRNVAAAKLRGLEYDVYGMQRRMLAVLEAMAAREQADQVSADRLVFMRRRALAILYLASEA